MPETITGFVFAKDEEANIADCLACMEGCDELVVADGGSTDRTMEIAESLGARVFRRTPRVDQPTESDREKFRRRFGWTPEFTPETWVPSIRSDGAAVEWMESIAQAKGEWIVNPDADERVFWELDELRDRVLPVCDQVQHPFAHAMVDGQPTHISTMRKMFRKSHAKMVGRTHGVIEPAGRVAITDCLHIEHHRDPEKTQGYVLPIMEYSVLKEDDSRARFYLGREYYYRGRFEEALTLLHLYLEVATWMPEIAMARLHEAGCYWELNRGDEARKACLEAVLINPDHRAALEMYAEMHDEPWKSKWSFIAENATDKDILY